MLWCCVTNIGFLCPDELLSSTVSMVTGLLFIFTVWYTNVYMLEVAKQQVDVTGGCYTIYTSNIIVAAPMWCCNYNIRHIQAQYAKHIFEGASFLLFKLTHHTQAVQTHTQPENWYV